MAKTLVFLAEGLEEIEAVTIIDVLRRASIEVQSASIGKTKTIRGAHGIVIEADALASDLIYEANLISYDAIVLPGGLPGTDYLNESEDVEKALKFQQKQGKVIGAICAAPRVLCSKGVAEGKNITHYPGCVASYNGAVAKPNDKVVVDGNLITSQGPGTASLFALQLVESLLSKETADTLAGQLLVCR